MLVNHQKQPYRVKVIDFSLACDTSAASMGSYIQSRSYRLVAVTKVAFSLKGQYWIVPCCFCDGLLGCITIPVVTFVVNN